MLDLRHREAGQEIVPKPREAGEIAPGSLGAALEDVAGGDRSGQLVPLVPPPAVPPGGRPGDHGGVRHAAGDHDVRAFVQRRSDPPPAQVGVDREQVRRRTQQPVAGVHIGQPAPDEQLFGLVGQVVAGDVGDPQPEAPLDRGGPDRLGHPGGVEEAGVGDDLDAPVRDGSQVGKQLREEDGGEELLPLLRVVQELGDQHRLEGFGHEVTEEHIGRGVAIEALGERVEPVAHGSGEVRDPHRTLFEHDAFLRSAERRARSRCASVRVSAHQCVVRAAGCRSPPAPRSIATARSAVAVTVTVAVTVSVGADVRAMMNLR